MFETDIEMDIEGMTVPYPPLFDDIRKNRGFVDVRGRPDLASEIAEGAQSPAMKKLLVDLAHPNSQLFTIGCDLGTAFVNDNDHPHTAGGYVQIMDVTYEKLMPEDYARFAQAVAGILNARSRHHLWRVHFILKPVVFKLDTCTEMTGSLWIWFHAFSKHAEKALASRETLIAALGHSLTEVRHTLLSD